MNRRHFAGFLLAGLALLVSGRSEESRASLRVLSYNIHHGAGVDGRLDLARIAAVIVESAADVVALQEVDWKTNRTGGVDQAAEIGRLTGLHAVYGKAMDYQGGAYGQALLSRWPLTEVTVHRLPNPSQREPRIAVSALVQPPGRQPFRFVGTHLDASREDGDRWQQADALIGLFANYPHPTILAGDFNAEPTSRIMLHLASQWADASATAPAPTVPAENPRRRIDYVLLRPAQAWAVRSSKVLPEAVASDHRPVLVELVETQR